MPEIPKTFTKIKKIFSKRQRITTILSNIIAHDLYNKIQGANLSLVALIAVVAFRKKCKIKNGKMNSCSICHSIT